jgi:hypothetical protein
VCNRSKKADSLSEISAFLKVSEGQVIELLGLSTQLTPDELDIVPFEGKRPFSIRLQKACLSFFTR